MSSYVVNDKDLKRSLNLNIFAITFGMVFFTVVGNPIGSAIFTGFMRKLGAGNLVYSIVLALPVLGAVSQIFGSYLLETTGKRKFMFLSSGLLHRFLWIPVALIPLTMKSDSHQAIIWSITVLITISSVAGSVTSIAFNSWMGSLVPADIIGRFFSKRMLVSTISGSASALIVGLFIDRIDNLTGFMIVFVVGSLFGLCDVSTFFFIKHPPMSLPENKTSLLSIIVEPLKNRNYLKFVLFSTVFAFGVNISAPFYNIYMLEDLKINYFLIYLSNLVMQGITTILFVRKWGVLADRYGNKPVTFASGIVLAIVPLMWVFTSPSNLTMVFIANIFAGIGWSGYNLSTFNQLVWLAPERNRSAYIASYTLFTSVIGTAAAYICGGIFMQYAQPFFENAHVPFIIGTTLSAFFILLAVSCLIRFLALAFFYKLYDEKNAKPVNVMVSDMLLNIKSRFSDRQA
jgi:MFS family permease